MWHQEPVDEEEFEGFSVPQGAHRCFRDVSAVFVHVNRNQLPDY
jgi:hypothetical protein